jgi:TRAP-type mannitol/chloroaromatic compound transport system substrate-binding protein
MFIHSYAESAKNWQTMLQEYPNIQVKTFPAEVIKALKTANDDLLKEKAAADPMAAKIIESQQQYMKQVRAYTAISEQGYLNSTEGL